MTVSGPRIEPVVESPWYDISPPWPWPIANIRPFAHILLSGEMTFDQIGSVFGQFQDCSEIECEDDRVHLLSSLANTVFGARGGLRVCGQDSVSITPGCCCGLENWREWLSFLETGTAPFLGHDPSPCVEDCGEAIRVWADGKNGDHVTFRRVEFVQALRQAHEDLKQFLRAAGAWAKSQGAFDVEALIDKVDHCMAINYEQPLFMECG